MSTQKVRSCYWIRLVKEMDICFVVFVKLRKPKESLNKMFRLRLAFCSIFYVLAMVWHLKNINSTFVQMPDRITNIEFTTVSPTIVNTILCATLLFIRVLVRLSQNNYLLSYQVFLILA